VKGERIMTLRLVALMSVVLLLSLAAVGVLLNHYQEQFMQEVQTTAPAVAASARVSCVRARPGPASNRTPPSRRRQRTTGS
jgi:hypothetical protein